MSWRMWKMLWFNNNCLNDNICLNNVCFNYDGLYYPINNQIYSCIKMKVDQLVII